MPNDVPPPNEPWMIWLVEHMWMLLAAVGAWLFRDLHQRIAAQTMRIVALEADRAEAASQRAVATTMLDAIDNRTKRIETLLDARLGHMMDRNTDRGTG